MTSHTIRVTSYSVCFLSQLFRTLHTSMYNFTPSILLTSYPYERYHHTAFMKTQRLYGTSHSPYLTSQPLYLCHHTDGTHRCIAVSLYWWHHNKCVSNHTWHTYDIIPNLIPSHSHYMTWMIMFYDIPYTEFMTSDFLSLTSYPLFRTSHHFIYDIKSTVSVLRSTASVSSHPTYRWHHSQYIEGITCSISVITYPLCFWQNIH